MTSYQDKGLVANKSLIFTRNEKANPLADAITKQ
jgi:hypothetical protein